MSATTFPLASSMRVTVPASWLATHSDPPPTARLWGLSPVVTGRPVGRLVWGRSVSRCGRRRRRWSPIPPRRDRQVQGARGTVMVAASAGTRRGLPTTRLVAGSTRTTVPGTLQYPEHPVGYGHAGGAGKGDDRGEPAAFEGGHGGAGGRGWRRGRSRAAWGVGGAGASGGGQQYRDDQRRVPAWSATRRRPEAGGGWHGGLQGLRIEHPCYVAGLRPVPPGSDAAKDSSRGAGRAGGRKLQQSAIRRAMASTAGRPHLRTSRTCG
jgi:hypothetical protein